MIKKLKLIIVLFALTITVMVLTGCTPKPEQLQLLLEQTLAAMPTQTAYPTYTPIPTPTKPIHLEESYSDFTEAYYKMFEFLAKAEGNQDKLKPLDLFFDVVKDEIALTASVSVANSMRNTTAPFVYPFYVISKIVRDGEIDYPTDIDYFTICLIDEDGYKYEVHSASWSDFLQYVDKTITFDQLFARMEHD